MLGFLPSLLLAVIFLSLLAINTILFASLIIIFSPLTILVPTTSGKQAIRRYLNTLAVTWGHVNNKLLFPLLPKIHWDIDIPKNLSEQQSYFLISNHQSWVDIMVLFFVFIGKIPFLKYFLKYSLLWIPFLGQGMYALDFPFMRRHSQAELEKKPHLKGKDLETTRRSCERFKNNPVSVINFLEGTRFSQAKHDSQQSPFKYLLKPKSGGMAFTLSALGTQMSCLLDVTIVYPQGKPTFMDLCSGKVSHVVVRVKQREFLPEAFTHNYESDQQYRLHFQKWIASLWEEKNTLIDMIKAQNPKHKP